MELEDALDCGLFGFCDVLSHGFGVPFHGLTRDRKAGQVSALELGFADGGENATPTAAGKDRWLSAFAVYGGGEWLGRGDSLAAPARGTAARVAVWMLISMKARRNSRYWRKRGHFARLYVARLAWRSFR